MDYCKENAMKQNKWKKPLTISVIMFMLLLSGCTLFLYVQNKSLTKKNKNLQREIGSTSQAVYIAINDIDKGETIKSEGLDANVELQPILTGLEIENYITEEDLGSIATVDIGEGVPVMINMVADKDIVLTQDLREYEIENIDFISSQQDYDVVDVRICFLDGSDYSVLTKKQIQQLNVKKKKCIVMLNEEEIIRYQSATTDAKMNNGILYTVNYVEDSLQEKSVADYPIRENVRATLKSNPNVTTRTQETLNVAERRSLEKRLFVISNIQEGQEEKNLIRLTGLGIAVFLFITVMIRNKKNGKAHELSDHKKWNKKEKQQNKNNETTSITKDYMEYANQIIHGNTVVSQCKKFHEDMIAIHIINRNGEIWLNYFDEMANEKIEKSINETVLSSLSIESEEGNYINPKDRFLCTIKRNEHDMITCLEFKVQKTETENTEESINSEIE